MTKSYTVLKRVLISTKKFREILKCFSLNIEATKVAQLTGLNRNTVHINGIENFWSQAKRHMRKFNGVPKFHFPLFLKECEWRFNNPKPKSQLKHLK